MMRKDETASQRRHYYDKSWGETLVVPDSDEEATGEDEENKEFEDYEDYILRLV